MTPRTLTLLFTDVEGSTRLVHEHGAAYPALLADHQTSVRRAAAAHGGVEVNTQGDAFFFVFEDPEAACATASDIHTSLAAGPIRVRIGIHTGEPDRIGDDYTGLDVHRAARICAAGHGGQTLVSERTSALLVGPARLRDLGRHRLKDLGQAEKLFQLGEGTFPPLRSLDATNLPAQPSPLIGRGGEVAAIAGLVRAHRMVTLVGPGGAGKTRLGLQVAAELTEEFVDGVFWVPLGAVRDSRLVLPAVAEALGASGELKEHVEDKRMLLLLDNLEQIVDCGPALAGLLSACPQLKLLATSRRTLRVAAERVYEVAGMAEAEAVELFRARAVDAEPSDAVREICRRLDRLPLAVELAAARTRLLPPPVLLARLERALPVLTRGPQDAPARHRTLRGAIEWSYDLLDSRERDVFGRLSVFRGSVDAAAAEAVTGAELEHLEALLDHSLLRRTQAGRLFMLETIQEFAAERLASSADPARLRRVHADYYASLAERSAPPHGSYPSRDGMRRLTEDEDNLRAALEWSIETAATDIALRICSSLTRFWEMKGRLDEGRRWFAATLALPQSAGLRERVRALRNAARLDSFAEYSEAALDRLRASVELARELNDPLELADSLRGLASAGLHDPALARPALQEALELAVAARDAAGEALARALLGELMRDLGDFEAAAEMLEHSIAISRARGDTFASATIHSIGDLELARGNPVRARVHYQEALRHAIDSGLERIKIYCVAGLAAVAELEGRRELAATLWAAAEAAERRLGFRMYATERVRYERVLAALPDPPAEEPLDLDAAAALALAP